MGHLKLILSLKRLICSSNPFYKLCIFYKDFHIKEYGWMHFVPKEDRATRLCNKHFLYGDHVCRFFLLVYRGYNTVSKFISFIHQYKQLQQNRSSILNHSLFHSETGWYMIELLRLPQENHENKLTSASIDTDFFIQGVFF